jgi:hypothetical protein
LLIIRFPSIERLLTCCKNQSELNKSLVIHIFVYFYSIDNINTTEKKFAEILSEKSSLKTLELESGNEFLMQNLSSKTYFWDDNKNFNFDDRTYLKNDIFEIYPLQVLNNMLNLIEYFYGVIYNKNNMITFVENPESERIENIINQCYSFSINLDITDILKINKENTLTFEFVSNKIGQILQELFKPLCNNFYCNEIQNTESNTSNNYNQQSFEGDGNVKDKDSYLIDMKHIIHNKNMRAKELFIIELNFVETNRDGTKETTKVDIYEKGLFNNTLEVINKKLNTGTTSSSQGGVLSSVELVLQVSFLPEIEDIFTELTKEELPSDNVKIYSIENEKTTQFYYNDNYLSIIPSYIKYHNQDYFISINIKQKTYLHKLIDSILSLQNIIYLESIRYNINTTGFKPDYTIIYDYFCKINPNFLTTIKITFKVSNKSEILNFMGEEGEVFLATSLSNSDRYIFIICFESLKEAAYKDFNNFCLNNIDKKVFKAESYLIPMWIVLTVSNSKEVDNRKRKYSVEDFRETEIVLEVRYIDEVFFNIGVDKQTLAEKVKEMVCYYMATLDKKVIGNTSNY